MHIQLDLRANELIEAIIVGDAEDHNRLNPTLKARIDMLATTSLISEGDQIHRLVRMLRVAQPNLARQFLHTLQGVLPGLLGVHTELDEKVTYRACRILNDLLYPMGINHYRSRTEDKQKSMSNGQYPYIAAALDVMPRLFRRHPEFFRGESFIDVGCGIGEKTFHAALLSKKMQCSGVEFDHTTVNIARSSANTIWDHGRIYFFCADALDCSFKKYDRIYTYVPLENRSELEKFYTHIWDTMPNDALWYEVDNNFMWSKLGKKIRNATVHGQSSHLMQTPAKRKAKRRKKKSV